MNTIRCIAANVKYLPEMHVPVLMGPRELGTVYMYIQYTAQAASIYNYVYSEDGVKTCHTTVKGSWCYNPILTSVTEKPAKVGEVID